MSADRKERPSPAKSTRAEQAGIDRLVQEARGDVQFFHDLIYNTEKVIGRLDYLSRQEKAAILSIDPDSLVVGIAGRLRPGGELEVCGASCGGSCGGTCAASCAGSCGASCGGSCQNSCAGTCGGSCGASCDSSCAGSCVTSCVASGDMPQFGQDVVLPAGDLIDDPVRVRDIVRDKIKIANFSRFNRQLGQ